MKLFHHLKMKLAQPSSSANHVYGPTGLYVGIVSLIGVIFVPSLSIVMDISDKG